MAKRTIASKALGAALAALAGGTVGLLGTKKAREKVPVWVAALLGVGAGGATLAVQEGIARDTLLGASGSGLGVVGSRADEMLADMKKEQAVEEKPEEGGLEPPEGEGQ